MYWLHVISLNWSYAVARVAALDAGASVAPAIWTVNPAGVAVPVDVGIAGSVTSHRLATVGDRRADVAAPALVVPATAATPTTAATAGSGMNTEPAPTSRTAAPSPRTATSFTTVGIRTGRGGRSSSMYDES